MDFKNKNKNKNKKIICFSLWCQDKGIDDKNYQTGNMYCNGAIRNLEIRNNLGIYKNWTFCYIRIYKPPYNHRYH